MNQRFIFGCIVLPLALTYLSALTGRPSIFLPILTASFAVVAFLVLLLIFRFIRRLLPAKLQQVHDLHPWRFRISLITVLIVSLAVIVRIQRDSSSNGSSESTEEELKALPYVTWVTPRRELQDAGVTIHDRERTYSGVNLFDSANLPGAFLMDMDGKILHRWIGSSGHEIPWQHVEVMGNGDLWAIAKDHELLRLSYDSKIQSAWPLRIHHDIDFASDGDIYAIIRKDEIVFVRGVPVPILNDYIIRLSEGGEAKEEHSLFPVLKGHIPSSTIWSIYRWMLHPPNLIGLLKKSIRALLRDEIIFDEDTVLDVFHTNALEIVQTDSSPPFREGDILISVRQLNLVGVVNLARNQLVWEWGTKDIIWQHHPTLLPDGNILIFDNGFGRDFSRIVELNPMKRIVWEFTSKPRNAFYSRRRGSCQRLPNGNTLITESNTGRVFEITKDGDTVWEFHNQEVNVEEGKRAAIYRMIRLSNPEAYPFIHRWLDAE